MATQVGAYPGLSRPPHYHRVWVLVLSSSYFPLTQRTFDLVTNKEMKIAQSLAARANNKLAPTENRTHEMRQHAKKRT